MAKFSTVGVCVCVCVCVWDSVCLSPGLSGGVKHVSSARKSLNTSSLYDIC